MTWTDLSGAFGFGATLTSTQMQNLRDNLAAMAAGDSGAPEVAQAALQNAAVGQAQLKTSTQTVTAANNARVLYAMSAGQYGLFPTFAISGSVGNIAAGQVLDGGFPGWSASRGPTMAGNVLSSETQDDVDYTGATMTNATHGTFIFVSGFREAGNAGTTSVIQRYVTASPPYDLGDGEVPLFVFALVNAAGDVLGVSVSDTPPWIYNGPTDLLPDSYRGGRAHKRIQIPRRDFELADTEADIARAYRDLRRMRRADREGLELVAVNTLIGRDLNNADMDMFPAPAMGSGDVRAVLLDPGGAAMEDLRDRHAAGEDVAALLHAGDIRLGNTPLRRSTPPGVPAVSFRWR